nr:MAG TPA: hypothetical protein [Caudoviricetes sp.]
MYIYKDKLLSLFICTHSSWNNSGTTFGGFGTTI